MCQNACLAHLLLTILCCLEPVNQYLFGISGIGTWIRCQITCQAISCPWLDHAPWNTNGCHDATPKIERERERERATDDTGAKKTLAEDVKQVDDATHAYVSWHEKAVLLQRFCFSFATCTKHTILSFSRTQLVTSLQCAMSYATTSCPHTLVFTCVQNVSWVVSYT